MRAVIQRVSRAAVTVDDEVCGRIAAGLLILLGVSATDTEADAAELALKIVNLRIFDDSGGKLNLSLAETGGSLLVVSQFTLFADTRRGRRPSYMAAASPSEADRLYKYFVSEARRYVARVETGKFQAMMQVELVNDGPVTIIIDTKEK